MSEASAYYYPQPKICAGCDNYVNEENSWRCRVGAKPFGLGCIKLLRNDHDALNDSQKAIVSECDAIRSMLLEKNRKYGDSALNPSRIFSKADCLEQINVRIDDKLKRIMNRQNDEDEDVDLDLIGYLILRRIARKRAC